MPEAVTWSHLSSMVSSVQWAAQKALRLHRNSTIIVLLLVCVLNNRIFVVCGEDPPQELQKNVPLVFLQTIFLKDLRKSLLKMV